MQTASSYLRGLRAGIPIGLGYLSVSFSFGIMASSIGLAWWQGVLISMLTLTSAGQLAGVQAMALPGQYLPMLIAQLTINLRYSFMSVSLAQKTDGRFRGIWRWLLGFFMTDEIFAVANEEGVVRRSFFFGLATLPYLGWAGGTLIGALLGDVLPAALMEALSLAIYGMFIAIIAPRAARELPILTVVAVAVGLQCAFTFLPLLSAVPAGISISVSAVVAALLGALLFPSRREEKEVAD